MGKESHYRLGMRITVGRLRRALSPHALAPTVLHATTSDKCREIVTDVKQIAPKVHGVVKFLLFPMWKSIAVWKYMLGSL